MRDRAMAQTAIFQTPTVETGNRYQIDPCESYGGVVDLGHGSPR
jgi:hypothetical protein